MNNNIFRHRYVSSILIKGKVLEIGALNNPFEFILPENVTMEYLDRMSYEELKSNFPEVEEKRVLNTINYVADIDVDDIFEITNKHYF